MTRKTAFFEGWSWFKFNNLGLALGTKFCTSVAKGLKLKVRKFLGPTPTFVEVTGEKLVGGAFSAPPILNSVKYLTHTPFQKSNFYYWCRGVLVITTEQFHSSQPELRFCAMLVGTILEEGLKTLNFLSLLWKETMEMFSVRQGNKSKHKFVGTKVC